MSLLQFDKARAQLVAAARRVNGVDRVPLNEALGRVLAEALIAPCDVPPFDNSGMDGYAVRCADLAAPGVVLPIAQRIAAGNVGQPLAAGTAARIFTGAPVPPGADAVVMQELCSHAGEGQVCIDQLPRPGENIRCAGEDIRQGEAILPAGRLLDPAAIGLAASVGLDRLPVWRRLSVVVFSTGDELATPGQAAQEGRIFDANRPMLISQLQALGCLVRDGGQLPDDLPATRRALVRAAAEHDLIISSGGVSVGEEDHVRAALAAEGEVMLWKVAIKPGKPLLQGRIGSCDYIGLPGNPVSAFVTFQILVRPFLRRCQGLEAVLPRARLAIADFTWNKAGPRREFLRVREREDGQLELFPRQSSGVLSSCVWADGLVDNPPSTIIQPGDTVRYLAFAVLP